MAGCRVHPVQAAPIAISLGLIFLVVLCARLVGQHRVIQEGPCLQHAPQVLHFLCRGTDVALPFRTAIAQHRLVGTHEAAQETDVGDIENLHRGPAQVGPIVIIHLQLRRFVCHAIGNQHHRVEQEVPCLGQHDRQPQPGKFLAGKFGLGMHGHVQPDVRFGLATPADAALVEHGVVILVDVLFRHIERAAVLPCLHPLAADFERQLPAGGLITRLATHALTFALQFQLARLLTLPCLLLLAPALGTRAFLRGRIAGSRGIGCRASSGLARQRVGFFLPDRTGNGGIGWRS